MRYPKGGDAIQPGDKVTHYDDDEIGTILDVTPRGLRVMWWSGEETEEVSENLHLMDRDNLPDYMEGPGVF